MTSDLAPTKADPTVKVVTGIDGSNLDDRRTVHVAVRVSDRGGGDDEVLGVYSTSERARTACAGADEKVARDREARYPSLVTVSELSWRDDQGGQVADRVNSKIADRSVWAYRVSDFTLDDGCPSGG